MTMEIGLRDKMPDRISNPEIMSQEAAKIVTLKVA
jgi:hypothetical protein